MKMTPRGARVRGYRRGQAEIIGGLIVLTLIFMFAVPIMLNAYYGAQRSAQASREAQLSLATGLNERLAVGPVPPSELALRAGWIPGVWINNTGTTPVTLDKLYLINTYNNTIYAVIDLKTARPTNSEFISDMLLNPIVGQGVSQPLPPPGTPITLNPGDDLLIVFNQTKILGVAQFLIARVESASGILHPLLGGGGAGEQTLLGGRPGGGGAAAGGTGVLWRGIFAPQSGFKLIGFDQIVKFSNIWAERPCYRESWSGTSYYGWAISNDPDHPPYYMLEYYRYWSYRYLQAFLGTFDWSSSDTSRILVDGWYGGSSGCVVRQTDWSTIFWDHDYYLWDTSWKTFTYSDMDSNGVDELTFFTYWIHYYGGSDWNPDSDGDGDSWSDSVAGIVQIARDISGVDFIKMSVKVIYDISIYGSGSPSNVMKVFSLAVWKYYPDLDEWRIVQAKDFDFVDMGPKVFEASATFPVERNSTYRVGIVFYDPYIETYGGAYYEFMMGLEHVIVEYGVLNPLFRESPPLYLVAIPDSNIISGIGEEEYAAIHNETLDQAKLDALSAIVSKLKEELNYAGIAGYTIIDSGQKLCELLFGPNKPKYAVVYWLQGAVDPADVASQAGCTMTDAELRDIMLDYHWVWVSPYGLPFGDPTKLSTFEGSYADLVLGPFNMTITRAGIEARREAYAFYLYNLLNFTYGVRNYTDSVMIMNATFYMANLSTGKYFGTAALWLWTGSGFGGAVLVLNPVHVDWDANGDGVIPETIVQQIVYSSIRAWSILEAAS